MVFCCGPQPDWSDGEEVEDEDATNLSYVGTAAYECLRTKHNGQFNKLWNVTHGEVVGELQQTPLESWKGTSDPEDGHSDWFPGKMAELMSRTEHWCDLLSLSPPDGIFMEKLQESLLTISERAKTSEKPITIRLLFGNIVGMPVNCTKVLKKLTEKLPETPPNIHVWVGAWRKGVSWNHAKIIAVDGLYLHTGGHNMWDHHYLKHHPVHDLSLEMKGRVAHDGHLFANDQWRFIESVQNTCCGDLVDKLPDTLPVVARSRVTVTEFPRGQATEFPPYYKKRLVPTHERASKEVPVITMGRYGSVLRYFRPSDDAFLAMFGAAKKIIRLALQDLGPVKIPKTNITVPGCVWPHEYLEALATAIWTHGVDVEIVLSNPNSIPGGLGPTEANYGNGWSCVDVAAEIIKKIRKLFPEAEDDDLRKKVAENLRVCFIRRKAGAKWDNGADTVGQHAKHFIIDDICSYVGSQNLYICDLAEWGVVIDHKESVEKMLEEYWKPMWEVSFTGEDCDVQSVMDGLDIDRDGEQTSTFASAEQRKQQKIAAQAQTGMLKAGKNDPDLYDEDTDDEEEEK